MKNYLSHLKHYGIIMCCWGFFFSSCSQSEVENGYVPSDVSSSSLDLTGGYNVIVLNPENIDGYRLKLSTTLPVKAEDENSLFRFEQIIEKDHSYLIAKLKTTKSDKEPKTINVKLEVEESPTLNKEVKIVLQPSSNNGLKSEEDFKSRVKELFGYGAHVWKDLGDHGSGKILNTSLISDLVDATTVNGLKYTNFEISGHTLSESMHRFSMNVGLSFDGASSAKTKYAFAGSVSAGGSETTSTKEAIEYYMGYSGAQMGEAQLDINTMINKNYLSYIDTTFNDVLNNPGSSVYQKYPDTPEGINKLLDYYGTDVITQGSFGGYAIGLYGRSENAYQHDVTYDVSASLNVSKKDESTAESDVDKVLKYLRQKNGMAEGGGFSIGISGEESEYFEASKAVSLGYMRGGNGETSMDKWKVTSDPNNWILISYNISNGDLNTFIPIQAFVADTSSARYKMIVQQIGTAENSPYFESKKMFVDGVYESPLVVADFMMKISSNRNGEPKPFVAKGPDNKKRVYYPVMANEHAPQNKGYALNTQTDYFICGTRSNTKKGHYWYYALDQADNCYGITDVIMNNNSNNGGYVRRGDHANGNVVGCINNNYVWLKYGEKSTKTEDKIKGIGLYYLNDCQYVVLGSTGGTEMISTWSDSAYKYFDSYWGSTNKIPHQNVRYKGEDSKFYEGGLCTKRNFSVCYTREEIKKSMIGTSGDPENGICHPRLWGE